jgi:hypothetical protein
MTEKDLSIVNANAVDPWYCLEITVEEKHACSRCVEISPILQMFDLFFP